ncbi:hypothetical protein BJ969_000202 [Saccharopolyspora gloriosae]|uniref:Uncharacterized protein n=1 Tax=Saccharopolyspora gloriosae TaxID=455344 RepID=A0A840N633_9PSEU|nr:hypothetical protein [Saccharopolyspora gloriosae]
MLPAGGPHRSPAVAVRAAEPDSVVRSRFAASCYRIDVK